MCSVVFSTAMSQVHIIAGISCGQALKGKGPFTSPSTTVMISIVTWGSSVQLLNLNKIYSATFNLPL